MLKHIFSLTWQSVYIALALTLLFSPILTQAAPQPPGQDPFGANGTSGLFEGYNAESPATTLFNGDSMQDNGMFTTPLTQLGGATPYLELIKPERSNEGGPSFIVLTSAYTPQGDLTSSSEITLTVTVKNVGEKIVRNIVFKAVLQDKNAALLEEPAPEPPMKEGSTIDTELVWDLLADGAPFTLDPGEETTISWSFKPNKDDTILRWRLTAEYGQGQSTLLQWIPIKNPNPSGGSPSTGSNSGSFTNPCATSGGSPPFPDSSSLSEIVPMFKQNWNIELVNSGADYTNEAYRGVLKAWWEVLLTVECTPYLEKAFAGSPLQIMGIGGAGGGWWGEYLGGNVQNMWLDNIAGGTVPHIKQNLIHELGHVYEGADPDGVTARFESTTCGNGSIHPYVSAYGAYGVNNWGTCNEVFAEMVGYFVVRESNEWGVGGAYCDAKNPYDWNQSIYYEFAKTIFGKEYGAPAPNPPGTC